jgi:hypothetical protein
MLVLFARGHTEHGNPGDTNNGAKRGFKLSAVKLLDIVVGDDNVPDKSANVHMHEFNVMCICKRCTMKPGLVSRWKQRTDLIEFHRQQN